MFERLIRRVEQQVAATIDDALEKTERLVAELPGLSARREGNRIVIAGAGLMQRWLANVRFRLALWLPR